MTYSEQLLAAIEDQNFVDNQTLLTKALDHDEPEVLASLAESLTNYGFTQYAKQVYRALIGQFPREGLFKVYLAEILLNDGQEDDGLALLFEIKPTDDAYLDSLLVQADYYQSSGLIEVAKQKLLQAKAIAPAEPTIKFGLAELDFLAGEYEQALPLYQELVQSSQFFGEVNINQRIFQTLAKLGRYEEAADLITKHPDDLLDIDAQYQAGLILLQTGDNPGAINYLVQVIEQSPDYVNAYPLLAQAYLNDQDTEQALTSAQTGLTYNEYDETLYSIAAASAAKLNKLAQAEQILRKSLQLVDDNQELRLQLSNLYLLQNKDEENLALFNGIESQDLEPQAHWNMAVSYQRLEQFNKAKDEFLLAYPAMQSNADFLKSMISLFTQLGQRELTIELIKKYLALVETDPDMEQRLFELENFEY